MSDTALLKYITLRSLTIYISEVSALMQ